MGTGQDAVARLAAVLGTDLPVLVDADGLTILSQVKGLLPRSAPTLITPHAGSWPGCSAPTRLPSRRGGSSMLAGRPASWASRSC